MSKKREPFCAHCGAPTERMYSIKSAAKLLDCSEQFFRNRIRDKKMGYYKVEGMVRIPQSEIDKINEYKPSLDEMVDDAFVYDKVA